MTEQKINVLDHGYVRLVDHMGNDLTVAQRARHMPDAPWRGDSCPKSDSGLINYLMRHRHTSPFEFVEFDFHIKAPIFIARQWMRHRTWSFNEISGRYQELPEEFYVPEIDIIGAQSSDNKQGRVVHVTGPTNRNADVESYRDECGCAFDKYKYLLSRGWPRELARMVLPLATYTEFSAKVDLHNLLHFLNLRLDEHAQYEIRVYAEAILKLIEPIVPVTIAAWHRHRQVQAPAPDQTTEKLRSIIRSLDGDHVDRLYLSKDRTVAKLIAELKEAIGDL